jgi:hypothetical protein
MTLDDFYLGCSILGEPLSDRDTGDEYDKLQASRLCPVLDSA